MATEVAYRTDQQKEKEIWEIDMGKKHDSRKTSQSWSLPLPRRRTVDRSPENEEDDGEKMKLADDEEKQWSRE